MAITATPAPATREALSEVVNRLWAWGIPQIEEKGGEWFSLSVRHPESCWYSMATTRTYGELVDAMAMVAAFMPEGVYVMASRCFAYDEQECRHRTQSFLLSQTGRHLNLQKIYE